MVKRVKLLIGTALCFLVAAAGCTLSDDKNSCALTADCLNGYQCLGQECVLPGRDAAVIDAGVSNDATPAPACQIVGGTSPDADLQDAGASDGTQPQPDLVVLMTEIKVDGFAIIIDYVIRNRGDGPATGFDLGMFVSGTTPPLPGAAPDDSTSYLGLAAGQMRTGSFFHVAPQTKGTAFLRIDPLENTEANLDNNLTTGILFDAEWTSPGPVEDAMSRVFYISTFSNRGAVAATEVSIHNASGVLLAKSSEAGCYDELALALDVNESSAVPYQIRISGVPGFAAGSYSITVTTTDQDGFSDGVPSDPDSFEPDGNCAAESTITIDGAPQDHTIAPFDTDCMQFSP